jgi:hypothetical protein
MKQPPTLGPAPLSTDTGLRLWLALWRYCPPRNTYEFALTFVEFCDLSADRRQFLRATR